MIAQNTNNLLAATFLWTENRLAQVGGAWQTLTMRMFPTEDSSLPPGYQGYSFPLKGLIYDSGVSGAYVMQSVSGGGFSAPLTRASGIHIDYTNARVLVPTSLGTNLVLTGTASVKEVNLYLSNEDEDPLVTQGKYFVNPSYLSPLTASGAPPNIFATPAIFINPMTTSNEAFSFGGLVNTRNTLGLTVFAETNFQLNAILDIFRDAKYGYYAMMNTIQDPLDQWNDLKGGTGYNYVALSQMYGQPGNLVYIENVHTAKVSDAVKVNPQLFAGIIDLDVSYIRQAPQGTNIFV